MIAALRQALAACFMLFLGAAGVSLQVDPPRSSQAPIAALFDASAKNVNKVKSETVSVMGSGLGPSLKQRSEDAPSLMRSEVGAHHDHNHDSDDHEDDSDDSRDSRDSRDTHHDSHHDSHRDSHRDSHDDAEAKADHGDGDDKKDPRPWLTRSHSLSLKHHRSHKGDAVGADDESDNAPDPNAEAPAAAAAAASTPSPAPTAAGTSAAPATATATAPATTATASPAPATSPAATAAATQSAGSGVPAAPANPAQAGAGGGQQAGALLLLLAVLVSLLALVLAVTALIVAIRYRNSGSAIFEDYGLLGARRQAGVNGGNYRRSSGSGLWAPGTPHQSLLPSSQSSSQQSLQPGRIPTTELLLPKPMGRPGSYPISSDDEANSSDGLWGVGGDPRNSRKTREKPLD